MTHIFGSEQKGFTTSGPSMAESGNKMNKNLNPGARIAIVVMITWPGGGASRALSRLFPLLRLSHLFL